MKHFTESIALYLTVTREVVFFLVNELFFSRFCLNSMCMYICVSVCVCDFTIVNQDQYCMNEHVICGKNFFFPV